MQDDLKAIPCALPGHTVCYVAAQVFLTGLLPQECHVLVTRQDLSPAGSLLPFSRHPVLSHTSFGSWLPTFALQESFSFTSFLLPPSPFLPVLPLKPPTVLQGEPDASFSILRTLILSQLQLLALWHVIHLYVPAHLLSFTRLEVY